MLGPILIAAILAAGTSSANRSKGQLSVVPTDATLTLPAGETVYADGAMAYRPANLPDGPRPLVVILHGNPQPPEQLFRMLQPWAEHCGGVLLAPKAHRPAWDVIDRWMSSQKRRSASSRGSQRFGRDVPMIDQDLRQLFGSAPIDPQRITLFGFSDGASYSLSLGLANPQLFKHVIALSPGFAIYPERVSLDQKIFIGHGNRDSRLPVERSRDGIVKAVEKAGMSITYREFDGDHVIHGQTLREAMLWATGCARPMKASQ